ncbi:1-hydroxycarotenoid 3,4-desaturase CrtD [Bacteroidota bacterium]
MKIAIIGSGLAGMASGIRLASKGHEVDVYESKSIPGGKISEIHDNGYRFDTGPSLITLPYLIEELENLVEGSDKLELVKFDKVCKYFFNDGSVLDAYADPLRFAKEAEKELQVGKKRILRYLKHTEKLFNFTRPIFLEKSLHKLSTYFTLTMLKSLQYIHKYHIFRSVHDVNKKYLKDYRMVQLFDRFATYNGSNPYKTPGIMAIIAHLEHNIGLFLPKNGMNDLISYLQSLALKKGVKFHFNSKVEKIRVSKSHVKGIQVNDQKIDYEAVISNADIYYTYQKLLPEKTIPIKLQQHELSSSAIIFYWGVKRESPSLDTHNVLFSEDYKAEFEALYKRKELYHDPTIYIFISSKFNKYDAPDGCENWYVMVNSPVNEGQNWKDWLAKSKKIVLDKIKKRLDINLDTSIETEKIIDPSLLEEYTSSFKGALYGPSSNSLFSAFLRHPNFSGKIKGLYFCGGSVHPGGGIPLCLLSAKIVSELIN